MFKSIKYIWKKFGKKTQWFLIWLIHPKFNVGVSVIIQNTEGKFLLGKHVFSGEKPWRLIGGYINTGENIFDAGKREAKEELGIDVEIERLLRVRTGFRYRIEFTLVAKPIDLKSGVSVADTPNVDLDGNSYGFILDKNELEGVGWFEQGKEPEDTLDSHVYLLDLYKKSPVDFVEVKNL